MGDDKIKYFCCKNHVSDVRVLPDVKVFICKKHVNFALINDNDNKKLLYFGMNCVVCVVLNKISFTKHDEKA